MFMLFTSGECSYNQWRVATICTYFYLKENLSDSHNHHLASKCILIYTYSRILNCNRQSTEFSMGLFFFSSRKNRHVCWTFRIDSMSVPVWTALNMSNDVAGATFMAAATSAPELFVNVIGTFITEGDIGVGTIVGSAVFNILAVAACCGIGAGIVSITL